MRALCARTQKARAYRRDRSPLRPLGSSGCVGASVHHWRRGAGGSPRENERALARECCALSGVFRGVLFIVGLWIVTRLLIVTRLVSLKIKSQPGIILQTWLTRFNCTLF